MRKGYDWIMLVFAHTFPLNSGALFCFCKLHFRWQGSYAVVKSKFLHSLTQEIGCLVSYQQILKFN